MPLDVPNKDFDLKKGVGGEQFIVLENQVIIIGTVIGGYDGHLGVMNYVAERPYFRVFRFVFR